MNHSTIVPFYLQMADMHQRCLQLIWDAGIILAVRYMGKPAGNVGLFDPAEIYNRSELKFFLKESMVKLGFHLVFFFLYLYR